MTIALITDGMLQNTCCYGSPVRAPDDAQAIVGTAPTIPCSATASDPTTMPPSIPAHSEAFGPTSPTIPCGTIGYDPTINPPHVPVGTQANEEQGTEAPVIPRCPEGHKT